MICLACTTLICTTTAEAATPLEPEPEPHGLRLDESPELTLLEPYRHASGRSASPRIRWQHGPYGGGLRRAWATLDWEHWLADADRAGSEAPINPQPGPVTQRSPWRATSPFSGWPFLAPRHHWFLARRGSALSLDPQLFPEWLRRLDLHYAHALLALHGCDRAACSLGVSFPAEAARAIWNALDPPTLPPPWWDCRERESRIMRYGLEQEVFVVLHCDGSVPMGALEKLSMLARPPATERPDELPATPDPKAERGEWVPGIRLLNPRLLWVIHRIAQAHPWRGLYIYSGYRPSKGSSPGSHKSQHAVGRALDLKVDGVSSEELLALCWRLPDVSCGYYPNHPFVHIDVRVRGTGSGVWVDDSEPGQPSRFVNEWPGVVEGGTVVWRPPP
jgi:Peptidase M15